MIDDAIAVTECGVDSVTVNALIQSKVEMKNLRVEDETMLTSDREQYLGYIFSSDCKIILRNVTTKELESVTK